MKHDEIKDIANKYFNKQLAMYELDMEVNLFTDYCTNLVVEHFVSHGILATQDEVENFCKAIFYSLVCVEDEDVDILDEELED